MSVREEESEHFSETAAGDNTNTHSPPGFVAGGWRHPTSSFFHAPAA